MQNRKVPTIKKVYAYKLMGGRDRACERFERNRGMVIGLSFYGGLRSVFRRRRCLKSYVGGVKVKPINFSSSSLFNGFDK